MITTPRSTADSEPQCPFINAYGKHWALACLVQPEMPVIVQDRARVQKIKLV